MKFRTSNQYISKTPDGISFERLQFPIRLAFAMTINKSQGQTCERLGLDFEAEPFAHGQLYTSVTRARTPQNIRIFAPDKERTQDGGVKIRNVVANICFD